MLQHEGVRAATSRSVVTYVLKILDFFYTQEIGCKLATNQTIVRGTTLGNNMQYNKPHNNPAMRQPNSGVRQVANTVE